MASKHRVNHPLLTAVGLSLVISVVWEGYKAFRQGWFEAGISPEALGAVAGSATATVIVVFIPIAVVLLIWQWIAGMLDKGRR